MPSNALPEDARTELISTIRTVVGDELRSITYFSEDTVEQLYLRDDLEADADLIGFADIERLGFRSQMDYQGTELGPYQFTVRVFERGYLTRIIIGEHGVFVTTDAMAWDRFEEVAAAVGVVLRDCDDPTGGA